VQGLFAKLYRGDGQILIGEILDDTAQVVLLFIQGR